MIRIHIICEGQTEEMFVNELLSQTFVSKGIHLTPSLIGKPGHKGGNVSFERLFIDVRARLHGDSTSFCTTFFDFYGLPKDFPGKKESTTQIGIEAKASCLSSSMQNTLQHRLGEEVVRRFIPYVQMYEFEGLLFSNPQKLALGICRSELSDDFQKIRSGFDTPEEINDSSSTAPSKRISKHYRGYEKPLHGSLAALEIGLVNMRAECKLFDRWLKRLEALSHNYH